MADEEKTDKKEPAKKSFVPFFEQGANIHMSLKVSKDGLEREEDTEVLKGMYEEEKPKNMGYKIWREAYGKEENGSKPTD